MSFLYVVTYSLPSPAPRSRGQGFFLSHLSLINEGCIIRFAHPFLGFSGFPLKTCGNDKRGRLRECLPLTVVIGGQRGAGRESAAAAVAFLLRPRFALSLPGLGLLPARRFAVRVARVCASGLAVTTVFADVGMIEESAGRKKGEVIR